MADGGWEDLDKINVVQVERIEKRQRLLQLLNDDPRGTEEDR